MYIEGDMVMKGVGWYVVISLASFFSIENMPAS